MQQDVYKVMTTSQDWCAADYGHYGPSSFGWRGTVLARNRIGDGRGGRCLWHAPLCTS